MTSHPAAASHFKCCCGWKGSVIKGTVRNLDILCSLHKPDFLTAADCYDSAAVPCYILLIISFFGDAFSRFR